MGKLRPGKVALAPASDAYPKGWHQGDTGGLDAVDTDLATGNIKTGVTIFGKEGTVVPGDTLTDYHYYEDLAAAASYTPPAKSRFTFTVVGTLESDRVALEFYDGSGWVAAEGPAPYESFAFVMQDEAQSVRITNHEASARKISLTGWIWS